MAENDTPADAMMSLAGHVSEEMTPHYVHVRDQARETAVAALPGAGLFPSPRRGSVAVCLHRAVITAFIALMAYQREHTRSDRLRAGSEPQE
jgi:hypothetical protein